MHSSILKALILATNLYTGGLSSPVDNHVAGNLGSFAGVARDLPKITHRSITVNTTSEAWEGKHWNYAEKDPKTGKLDEFTIYVVDSYSDSSKDVDLVPRTSPNPAWPAKFGVGGAVFDLSPTSLDSRDGEKWYCRWVYGCVNAATTGAYLTANQGIAVANAINDRMRANNNELFKRMFDGIIIGLSVAIVATPIQFYITNRMGQTKSQDVDVCATKQDLQKYADQMAEFQKQNIAMFQAFIDKQGDHTGKTFSHRSDNTIIEGEQHLHGIKQTNNPSDENNVPC